MLRNNSIRIFEISAVLATGLGKFIFVDLFNYKIWYIFSACICWMIYIFLRARRDKDTFQNFGFRMEGFKSSLRIIMPISALAVITFVGIGLITDRLLINWHIIPIMLLYPIWGTIQQFLMISLLATHLSQLEGFKLTNFFIVTITAVLFSVVHYPSYELISGTFLLAVLYTIIFIKYRNVWVLGIFHGWLGCFFYFFVLGRDALAEMLQSL